MTTAVKELLEDAAAMPPPPPNGLDQALSRARRLRLRARLAQAAVVPVAAAVVFAAIAVSSREPSSRLRVVPPASHPTTTTTETTLPGGVALPDVTVTTTTTVKPPSVYEVFRDTFFPGADQPPPPPVFAAAPSGFRIAFMRDNALWTMKADGTDRQKLFDPGRRPLSFASDGRTLVLETSADEHITATALDVVTGQLRELVRIPGGDVRSVDISPDGKRMVYAYTKQPPQVEDDGGPSDHVVVSDMDGRNAIELPNHGRYAAWSPDGSRIATHCPMRQDGTWEAWTCTMKPDGTDARVVPYIYEPYSWSPDGQWLAGRDTNGSRGGLRLVRVDGSEERLVGQRAFSDRPVWSPDSKHLIYTRQIVSWPRADVCLQPPCTWEEGVFMAPIDGGAEQRIGDSSWDWYHVAPFK